MPDLCAIEKPTLLLDSSRAKRNIARMADKARLSGVRFRPHFKTHQSLEIGTWFREQGASAITVSSVDMALGFADAGWEDILIAFPANLRQVKAFDALARRIHLELLVESPESVAFLEERLSHGVDAWIKVDVGNRRTGIMISDRDALAALARKIAASRRLRLRGLLTHAGQTYHAKSTGQIQQIFRESVQKMNEARETLARAGLGWLELSYGDTPACTLVDDFSGIDEIHPGNFIFYDLTQQRLGVCGEEDIAVAVACPVVARHCEAGMVGALQRIVIYGGAVHLSKEYLEQNGETCYGGLATLNEGGWGPMWPGAYLASLSQEHGVARVTAEHFERIQVGDLVAVIPVHSCLAVDLHRQYLTNDGRVVPLKLWERPDSSRDPIT